MINILRIGWSFAKASRPKPQNKIKQVKKAFTVTDDKAAKISKSEQQSQLKERILEKEKSQAQKLQKLKIYRRHDISLEKNLTQKQLSDMFNKQILKIKGIKNPPESFPQEKQLNPDNAQYVISENYEIVDDQRKKKKPVYGNYTQIINKPFVQHLSEFEGDTNLRRVGTLGVKLGMTSLWDDWGNIVPATVIELDRVQVVQIKQPIRENKFYQVQLGMGEKTLKKITKPLLGHFVKAKVPPKRILREFPVSKECLLPIGYMISARHYTPGMYVDVVGKTVGHGFQGTIKRWGFKRQPESHGNSVTTRVLGSTGGRQDPGRVFKKKKMYGHMGNKVTVQKALPIFKIDVDKNLLYLRGSVPGKAGTIIYVRDTLVRKKAQFNLQLTHFPTFVPEENCQYARQMQMYCGNRDPGEIRFHDNAYIIDDGEDEEKAPKQA